MDQNKLNAIIEAHQLWLEYQGKKGQQADLQNLNLHGANLQNVDLSWANLQGVNLQEADLRGIKLCHADLRIAYLRLADLRGADLSDANMRGADLWVADLRGTDLTRTNLRETNLQEADLRGARFQQTNLKYVKITRNTMVAIPREVRREFIQDWYIVGSDDDSIQGYLEISPKNAQQCAQALTRFGNILEKMLRETPAGFRIEQNGAKLYLFVHPVDDKSSFVEIEVE